MSHPKLEIKGAGAKGRGVFARASIRRGEHIIAFGGQVLHTHDLTDDLFALQIDHDRWLCSRGEHLDDYINHSCAPNAGFVSGEPALLALCDIASGEEIAFDYATSIAEPGWTLECACGAPECRGLVLPWGEMPLEYRERMRPFALRYLREQDRRC
jgi:SET domain-containing protein